MLHWMARKALEELADLGVADVTPDEIAELHDAARAVVAAEASGGAPSGCGFPMVTGGVILWPLTCAGMDFWEKAAAWWPRDTRLLSLTMAYAMAHGRTPGAFERLLERKEAAKTIRRWGRGLTCTMQELDRAIELCFAGVEICRADEIRKAAGMLATITNAEESAVLSGAVARALDDPAKVQAEESTQRNIRSWRSVVLDFCALTGCGIEDWLIQPTQDMARAYAVALSANAARFGAIGPDNAKEAVAEAVGDLRKVIKRIYESRHATEKAVSAGA